MLMRLSQQYNIPQGAVLKDGFQGKEVTRVPRKQDFQEKPIIQSGEMDY